MSEDKYLTCDDPRDDISGGFFLNEEEMVVEKHLMSEKDMHDAIKKMAEMIVSECGCDHGFVLVGVKSRGVPLANWLAKILEENMSLTVPVGSLDINLYRDDLSEVDEHPVVNRTELPFSIAGKGVILVDDVLYTGRTIRAALDALIDFGRPKFIKLAVMIDRGFRELPIQADYIGKKISTTSEQNVKVKLTETDGKNEVLIRG